MKIIGIETTCDETSAGVVEDGRVVLSNVISSSASLHEKYGGIVPEVAAREQVKLIVPVLNEAVGDAGCKLSDIDAIAVAHGPGLVGSLLIGVETTKALSVVLEKPLIPVNHLLGHVYANWLAPKPPVFPLIALIVSGGHTDLIMMMDFGKYQWLGGTRDDAAGEVFDKVARVLGLGYPGGPKIEKIAGDFQIRNMKHEIRNIKFPRPMVGGNNFDFSFAGLKTSVVNYVGRLSGVGIEAPAIAFEFQEAMVDVLVKKTIHAAKKFDAKSIVVGGGVAANERLHQQFATCSKQISIPVFSPPKNLSVDNGAMVAAAAYFEKKFTDPLKLQAQPALHF